MAELVAPERKAAQTLVLRVGQKTLSLLHFAGGFAMLTGSMAKEILRPPFYFRLIVDQMLAIGVQSFLLVAVTALATGYLAALTFLSGDTARAETLMQELAARRSHSYVSSSAFAIFYAAAGQADTMFQHLQAAFEEREPFLTRIQSEPYFWPYRLDPRYQTLLQNMHLA
jgi:ABC-type transporter Mla maintaining outer membrane lipid asymmetry permease subunit MlaE